MTAQLDLFTGITDDDQRHADVLTCLRDVVPETLEVVAYLTYRRRRDTRSPKLSGGWAYCVQRAGVRYERQEDWGPGADARGERSGWDRTPAHLVTWDELAAIFGDDPRRTLVTAWANSLTVPDAWRDIERPFELWPHPETWHPSYITGDHDRPGWTARRRAWQLVLRILDDAAAARGGVRRA